jgi:hypothetical protein
MLTLFKILKIKKSTIVIYLIISIIATSYYFFFLKKTVYYNKYIYSLKQFEFNGNLYNCSKNINFEFVGIENFLEKLKVENKFEILRYKIFINRETVFEIETTSLKNITPIEFDENLNNYLNRRESIVFLKKFIMQIEPSFKEIGEKKSTISEADKSTISEADKIKFSKNCNKKIQLVDSFQTSKDDYLFFFSMNISIFFFLMINNRLIQYVRKNI